MTEDEIRKVVELCADICASHARSLSKDDLHVPANEAQKCAGSIRARVGLIISQMRDTND